MPAAPPPIPLACGHCGYDLGNPPLRPCPECGKDDPRRPLRRGPIAPFLIRLVSAIVLMVVLWALVEFMPSKDALDGIGRANLAGPVVMITLVGSVLDFHFWCETDRSKKRSFPTVFGIWLAFLAIVYLPVFILIFSH